MHILVTGGTGYIGAHIAHACIARGHKVTVLDAKLYRNANHVAGAREVVGDVRDVALLNHLFTESPIDAVIHCAGLIQVSESVRDPGSYYDVNTHGSLCVLRAMAEHKVKYFIFSSTAAVYGEPQQLPLREDHPCNPINPYGASKHMVERLCPDFTRAHGLHTACLRYFNAAGCDVEAGLGEYHEPETHLIPLALQVASGRKGWLQLFGEDYATPDGTCIRDYIHVKDLAEAHIQALHALVQGAKSLVLNVGSSEGYTVRQVVKVAERITGKPIKVKPMPQREGDPAILVADASRIMRELNFSPRFSTLEQMMTDAWAWEQFLEQAQLNAVK